MRLYSAGLRKDLGIGDRVSMDLMKVYWNLDYLNASPTPLSLESGGLLSKKLNQITLDLVMTQTAWGQSESLY